MINELLEKELKGKYVYEKKGNELSIFYPDNQNTVIYTINEEGIATFERGTPVFIADFGNFENNLLAFALNNGNHNVKSNEKMHELRQKIRDLENNHSQEEIIKSLGLDNIVNNYLSNNDDIKIENLNDNLVKIKLQEGDYVGTISVDDDKSLKYYMDLIELIANKQHVNNLISDNMLSIEPDLFIKLVKFSKDGLFIRVTQNTYEENYSK